MDIKADFRFLKEHVAKQHNPYEEGEYIIIKPNLKTFGFNTRFRSFDFREAVSQCLILKNTRRNIQMMLSDYLDSVLRIFHQGKFYYIDCHGEPRKISPQQNWKIINDYLDSHYNIESDGQIQVCKCSYPTFWSYKRHVNSEGKPGQLWRPTTCLIEDNEREIDNCPNCDVFLDGQEFYEDEDYWEAAPEPCVGCKYYNDNFLLSCAVNPCGPVDDTCPDYSM